ncbi:chloride channel protein [Streptomyces sp. NBC_01142]|uniref:chloride channel protein n=1 Tax=Streptomyces sp. NBC_01142 TaxID=2975865 RepID=UPI00224E8617|nr:chloride channel protein [Streptomyces sp. NBC_01142]MCX4820143.1 chloride channel protein [Streptomyces sp. NBC_01142]
MTEPNPRSAASDGGTRPKESDRMRDVVRAPGYLKTLVFCALIGIPVSFAAFWFLVGLHELEHVLWADLPHALGWDTPPWWWPLPLLLIAGVVVGLVVTHLPGAGGHIPASGLHPVSASSAALPGVVLAAAASLPFGAVLGPEAPLIALGGGLALLFRDLARAPATPQSNALLGAAGAAAAIAAIFGNPLIAAVLLIEVAGVGGPQLFAIMLPALLSSGVGALVFTGFGRWTGLQTGSLTLKLPEPFPHLDTGDIVWSLLMAVVIGVFMHLVLAGGRLAAAFVTVRTLTRTVVCALGAAACAALYALITGRTPQEVASSGQATLSQMAADPHAWGIGALIAVLLFKGAAYAFCLGSLRGGPVFPSLFLGGAMGVLFAPLPGLGVVAGMAAGMAAATTSALRLPVSSVVLVVLLLGSSAMIPVVILAAVVAFVTTELLPPGPAMPSEKPAGPGTSGSATTAGAP